MGRKAFENIEEIQCNSYFIITKKFLTVHFWSHIWDPLVGDAKRVSSTSYAHTMVKPPDPIRTPKLSTIGPAQYCGGGPRGNRRCRMFLSFCSTARFEPHNARSASGSISDSNSIIKHTFSAFWLRSSVVSVLISLISDTMVIDHPVD